MITQQQLKKLRSLLGLPKTTLHSVDRIHCNGGAGVITNLDHYVVFVGAEFGGCYQIDAERYAQTGNWEVSKFDALPENLIHLPEMTEGDGKIDPTILRMARKCVIPYLSVDETRRCLMDVLFDPGFGAFATDGRIAIFDDGLRSRISLPFGIPKDGIEVIEWIGHDNISDVKLVSMSFSGGAKQYLRVGFSGGYALIKILHDEPIPAFEKVLPKVQSSISISVGDMALLRATTNELMKYRVKEGDGKPSHLMVFEGNNILLPVNFRSAAFGFELPFAVSSEFRFALDIELFKTVSANFPAEKCTVDFSHSIGAVVFRFENSTEKHMMMPLKILNVSRDDTLRPDEVFIADDKITWLDLPQTKRAKKVAVKAEKPSTVPALSFLDRLDSLIAEFGGSGTVEDFRAWLSMMGYDA